MQELDNDMDELFQRAAENYPLQDGKGDWESVAKRLAMPDESVPVETPLKNKKNRKFLPFFLFLVILLSAGLILHELKPISPAGYMTTKINQDNNQSARVDQKNGQDNNSSIQQTDKYFSSQEKNKPDKNIVSNGRPSTKKITTVNNNKKVIIKSNLVTSNTVGENVDTSESKISFLPDIRENTNQEIPENLTTNDSKIQDENLKEKGQIKEQKNIAIHSADTDTSKIHKASSQPDQIKKGFYIGVVAGLDFSKVESGSFGNTGFDAGLLAGYRLNKSLSFETGVFWNKKYYNSDGRYFSMDKIRSSMPSGMVIDNLQSQSHLIEIPVKVKFDFVHEKNFGLFVTGGLSSYIMTKEMNMYNATVNGTREKMLVVYEKNNYKIPTVVNLGFGYQHMIIKKLDIRIEPFIKIPLQGIGVGNLPLTSAGVELGITTHL